MTREAIIQKTLKILSVLPNNKAEEVADFADYIMKKHENEQFQMGIQDIVEQSGTFSFLNDDEELYSVKDIIDRH